MTTYKITGKQALKFLKEAVAERGADYVYPENDCTYALNGAPSCIAGVVFFKAGVPMEILEELDGGIPELAYCNQDPEADQDFVPIVMTPKAQRILTAAQTAQDGTTEWHDKSDRKSWGEALELAKAAADA